MSNQAKADNESITQAGEASNRGGGGDESSYVAFYESFGKVGNDKLSIIYTPKYNISFFGLEKLHPFDSCKYMNVVKELLKNKVLITSHFIEPSRMPTTQELLLVHTPEYLNSLKWSANVAMITEVPICAVMPNFLVRRRVLNPMLYGTSGTIMAGKIALDRGWCINLSGGYHHACGYQGGGFCVYSDITLSLRHLRKNNPHIKKAMIIDLDAHQGNGHARDKIEAADIDLFILDMYNAEIYPNDSVAKRGIDLPFQLRCGTTDAEYLGILGRGLEEAFSAFTPQIIYYNAGTDILQGDSLGLLDITPKGVMQRDEMVFQAARARGIPIVMVLSGGYQKTNAKVIADSIQNILITQNLNPTL